MMKKQIMRAMCLAAIASTAWSCIDDKYDLSDIDTTVRVDVDNLVIPVNIDEIQMKSIIDLKEDGVIKIVNGQYAVVEEGPISSADIEIAPISIAAPTINPSVTRHQAVPLSNVDLKFAISSNPSFFKFESTGISIDIVDINRVYANLNLEISLNISPNPGGTMTIEGLQIQFPKGLIIPDSKYNIETGVYKADKINVVGGKASLLIAAEGIDLTYFPNAFDKANRTFSLDGEFTFIGGELICLGATLHNEIELTVSYSITGKSGGDISVDAVDGRIEYSISDVNISRVNINDLPDVLNQEGTNISLANPVIYLKVNNPLQSSDLYAQTGMSITAYRNGVASKPYNLDQTMTIGYNPEVDPASAKNPDGIYSYYLSPLELAQSQIDPEFANAKHYLYSQLGNILSGNGIPSELAIDLINPEVPDQKVSHFRLGQNFGSVEGKYKFVAPIQFAGGSQIVYAETETGWGSEDLDNLTIETLDVDFIISTNIPLALEFTGYPIDANCNRINNVSIVGANIDANADNQKVTVHITGSIRGLDGIEFRAVAKAAANGSALSPDMDIKISNLRPRVKGYFEKEL